jgi:hypothetical protein
MTARRLLSDRLLALLVARRRRPEPPVVVPRVEVDDRGFERRPFQMPCRRDERPS